MHAYLKCPECQSSLKIERPTEQVKIGCPSCGNSFKVDPLSDQISTKPAKSKDSISGWVIAGYIFAVLGGYLGIGIAISLLRGEKKDRMHGIIILVISLIFMVLWKSAARQ